MTHCRHPGRDFRLKKKKKQNCHALIVSDLQCILFSKYTYIVTMTSNFQSRDKNFKATLLSILMEHNQHTDNIHVSGSGDVGITVQGMEELQY